MIGGSLFVVRKSLLLWNLLCWTELLYNVTRWLCSTLAGGGSCVTRLDSSQAHNYVLSRSRRGFPYDVRLLLFVVRRQLAGAANANGSEEVDTRRRHNFDAQRWGRILPVSRLDWFPIYLISSPNGCGCVCWAAVSRFVTNVHNVLPAIWKSQPTTATANMLL